MKTCEECRTLGSSLTRTSFQRSLAGKSLPDCSVPMEAGAVSTMAALLQMLWVVLADPGVEEQQLFGDLEVSKLKETREGISHDRS